LLKGEIKIHAFHQTVCVDRAINHIHYRVWYYDRLEKRFLRNKVLVFRAIFLQTLQYLYSELLAVVLVKMPIEKLLVPYSLFGFIQKLVECELVLLLQFDVEHVLGFVFSEVRGHFYSVTFFYDDTLPHFIFELYLNYHISVDWEERVVVGTDPVLVQLAAVVFPSDDVQ